MSLCRLRCSLVLAIAFLMVGAVSAEARSSRRRSDRNRNDRGRYRLIEGEDNRKDRREEERRKEREEERRRKEEEKKRQAEERKREAQEKKKAEQARKQAELQRQKTEREAAKARKPERAAAKKDTEQNGQEAAKLYEEAEAQFAEGELLPGVALLRECIDEYEGTDGAKDAEARLTQLIEHEQTGPAILLGEAEELFGAQRYRHAHNKYNELLTRFPDSEQAAEAHQRLAEIREGDLLSKTVYTDEELEDARFWLLVGNIHHENERLGQAKDAWLRVIEQFPGCPYAQQAEAKIVETRGS